MKTVRLSRNLQEDITRVAETKFKNANPEKEAALGTKLVSVIPGTVFTSKK